MVPRWCCYNNSEHTKSGRFTLASEPNKQAQYGANVSKTGPAFTQRWVLCLQVLCHLEVTNVPRRLNPALGQCWAKVCDVGPALTQDWTQVRWVIPVSRCSIGWHSNLSLSDLDPAGYMCVVSWSPWSGSLNTGVNYLECPARCETRSKSTDLNLI